MQKEKIGKVEICANSICEFPPRFFVAFSTVLGKITESGIHRIKIKLKSHDRKIINGKIYYLLQHK